MSIAKPAMPAAIPAAVTPTDAGTQKKVQEWIEAAPNGLGTGEDKPKRVKKGRKVQITHTLMETELDRLDALAESNGQTRAGLINLAIAQLLKRGLVMDGGQ